MENTDFIYVKSVFFAYAKINLTLNVTGKRPDGYHELESIMQAVSLRDDVTVILRPEGNTGNGSGSGTGSGARRSAGERESGWHIRVSVSTEDAFIAGQSIPEDRQNTVYKAAEEFIARQAPGNYSVDIRIDKRIPAAAGLGGGSADAAAALLALNDAAASALRKINDASDGLQTNGAAYGVRPLTEDELLEAALRVGADVPFCMLYGARRADEDIPAQPAQPTAGAATGAAYARGVGEMLMKLSRPPPIFRVALVNPRIEISTTQVYKDFQIPSDAEIDYLSKLTHTMIESHSGAWNRCFNVLERGVAKNRPQIGQIKSALLDAGALCAVMSGSGPTVFGLFGDTGGGCDGGDCDDGGAFAAAALLRARGYWTAVCAFI